MTKQEITEMIERAGFEAVERDTVYNRGWRKWQLESQGNHQNDRKRWLGIGQNPREPPAVSPSVKARHGDDRRKGKHRHASRNI